MSLITISPSNTAFDVLKKPGFEFSTIDSSLLETLVSINQYDVSKTFMFFDCNHINELLSQNSLYDNYIVGYDTCTMPDDLKLNDSIPGESPYLLDSIASSYLNDETTDEFQ